MAAKGVRSAARLVLMLLFLKNVFGHNSASALKYDTSIKGYPQNTSLNFTGITRGYGYTAVEHTVVTEDGYILTIFRIPKSKGCRGPARQPPVLLMHGVFENSDSWLDAGPSAGLALLLADACCDLWVGNVRGTDYGRRHVALDADSDAVFWDFTTHEMGKFDVPAHIEHILTETRSPQLMYIGYSQGARLPYIMCSETSGYCDKIRAFINIAPAVRLKYSRSIPLRLFGDYYTSILPLLRSTKELEVLPKGGVVQTLASYFCKDIVFAATVCKAALFFLDSYDPASISTETVRTLYEHTPAGTSARNVVFYSQHANNFKKYDYGPTKNQNIYGSIEPPEYMLNRTTMPVVLIYGKSDYIVDPRDVTWLAGQLPNVAECYEVKRPTWNHFDNTFSRLTKQQLFPKINEYLLKYSSPTRN